MALAACAPRLASIAPTGLAPVSNNALTAWLETYAAAEASRYDLRWRFLTPKGSTAGRASVRVKAPDSLRFDYRGPFGRSGAAVLVGDSALWAEPERDARELIPMAPLFWAALGRPLPPPADAEVFRRPDGTGRAWRYVVRGDTMDFVEVGSGPERLLTEVRRERITATTEIRFRPGTRWPAEGQMRFPVEGTLFVFTVEAIDTTATFEPGIWRRP